MRRGGKASASSSEEEGELQASKRELQASKQGNWKQERELQAGLRISSRPRCSTRCSRWGRSKQESYSIFGKHSEITWGQYKRDLKLTDEDTLSKTTFHE